MTKARTLAGILDDQDLSSKQVNITSIPEVGSLTVISNFSSLPASASIGEQAFVTENNSIYIFDDGGWRRTQFVNTFNPYWESQPSSSYSYTDTGANFTIEVAARDSDEVPLIFTATTDSDFLNIASVTVDSESANGVRYIIQFDSENIDSEDGGEGTVTFSVTDGANVLTQQSTFTLSFTPAFLGSTSGYTLGGTWNNYIQKFPFAISSGTASDVANLAAGAYQGTAGVGTTHGYVFGGGASPPTNSTSDTIQKHSFSSDTNGTDTGHNLTTPSVSGNLGAIGDRDVMYKVAGFGPAVLNHIDKYTESSASNATNVGNIFSPFNGGRDHGGSCSDTKGYVIGGQRTPSPVIQQRLITSFLFSNETTTVQQTGLLPYWGGQRQGVGGRSSTYGYHYGGLKTPQNYLWDFIDKWPFASEGNATDVGDMLTGSRSHCNHSSTTDGFITGGTPTNASYKIQKHPYASDANTTDQGNLAYTVLSGMGTYK